MAHGKIANTIATLSLPQLHVKAAMLSSLWLLLFSSNSAQADEPRVSLSQGYQLNHGDGHRHTQGSTWWLTPRYNPHNYRHPYGYSGLYPYQGPRLYPYAASGSSLRISWGNSPYYQNRATYRHPRWRHWNGFDDRFEDNFQNDFQGSFQDKFQDSYTITPWRNNGLSQQYQQADRYQQTLAIQSPPITRSSSQISHSTGLTSLPANAKVIQQENGTAYEWQGVLYRFDWGSQTYQVIKEVSIKN